jgi:hypothetical protein
VIIEDNCGPLDPATTIRRSVSALYTADATGPVLLEVYNWKEGPYSSLCVSFIDNMRVRPVPADFAAQPREISCLAGGTSQLKLNPGPDFAHEDYLILSSLSGTWPGFSQNGIAVPLNPDAWTWCALTLIHTPYMVDFMGQLDGAGYGKAMLMVPGSEVPDLLGLVLYFDYLVLEKPGGPPVKKASQPVYILMIP